MLPTNYSFMNYIALVSSWLSGRIADWHLSQPGFDPSFGNLARLATLKSSDRLKQICLWMTYIYISLILFIYLYIPYFIYLFIYPLFYLFIYISLILFIYLYILYLFIIYLFILSIIYFLFIYISFIYLFIYELCVCM